MADFRDFGRALAADGIKARNAHKGFASQWWARRWIALLESFGWTSRLARGRNYAKKGQVLEYDVQPGQVTARVQGSRIEPYEILIELPVLSDKDWQQAIAAMGERAAFAASLLAGEMPEQIEEAFEEKKPLLPRRARDFEMDCSCPDYAVPCKHLAAVFYLLAELFDQDPFLIFLLRGRTRAQILEQMPQLGESDASATEEVPPLDLTRFWAEPPDCPEFPLPSKVEASLLKRLGPPAPWAEEDEVLKSFLPLYRQLREP